MKQLRKFLGSLLIILTVFVSFTAIIGGIALITGINAPPSEQLSGSVFKNFFIPGAVLAVVVGGIAGFAAVLLIARKKYDALLSAISGIVMMTFEFFEVLTVGSPPGIAHNLQVFYFGMGFLIAVLGISICFIDLSVHNLN